MVISTITYRIWTFLTSVTPDFYPGESSKSVSFNLFLSSLLIVRFSLLYLMTLTMELALSDYKIL